MALYKHQQNIIDDKPWRVGLFLGTGSGKTRIATLLAQADGSTIVVCPKTQTQDGTWTDEWAAQGRDPEKLTLISKEQLKMTSNRHIFYKRFDTIIGDEAHLLAGVQPSTFQKLYKQYPRTSMIYKCMLRLIKYNSKAKVFLLTATPAPQPMTVYGLGTLLGYKWSFNDFRDTFYFEQRRGVWLKRGRRKGGGLTAEGEMLKEKLAKVINSIGYVGRLDDWFDVPEQTFKVEHVGVTKGQQDCFTELRLLYPDPLVQLGKRRMLEQGLFEGIELNENKTACIDKYMDEYGKVVVFARYTAQIEMYAAKLGKKWKVMTLTGASKDRGELIREANEAEECLLIVQNQISEGYELINDLDADAHKDFRCVMFATEYAYKDYVQGQGRVQRAKRIKHNLYVSLVAGEADKLARLGMELGTDFDEEVHAERLARSKKL